MTDEPSVISGFMRDMVLPFFVWVDVMAMMARALPSSDMRAPLMKSSWPPAPLMMRRPYEPDTICPMRSISMHEFMLTRFAHFATSNG